MVRLYSRKHDLMDTLQSWPRYRSFNIRWKIIVQFGSCTEHGNLYWLGLLNSDVQIGFMIVFTFLFPVLCVFKFPFKFLRFFGCRTAYSLWCWCASNLYIQCYFTMYGRFKLYLYLCQKQTFIFHSRRPIVILILWRNVVSIV